MSKTTHETPMLDQLEDGPWPRFVSEIQRLAQRIGPPRTIGVARTIGVGTQF